MMKQIALLLLIFLTTLYGDKSVMLSIHGDLDDDLFVLRSRPDTAYFSDCLQMHNPNDYFYYASETVPSRHIYGLIDFDKTYRLKEDEVLLAMTANEREEIDPAKALLARTHYKSVELKANGKVLIPSLMPEYNDVPDYPLWFGPDEKPIVPQKRGYNYYKLWENAVVNLGLIFAHEGEVTLYFTDHEGAIHFQKSVRVTQAVQNIKLLGTHPLTEADGSVYDGFATDDDTIRKRAIEGIIIEIDGTRRFVKLPYPMPYVNRIFIKGV